MNDARATTLQIDHPHALPADQALAQLGPMGMIFIPSVGGISHSPKEYSHPQDIVNGANVLLGAVLAADAGDW